MGAAEFDPEDEKPLDEFGYEKLMRESSWRPVMNFEEGLAQTIRWYRENTSWVARVRSGEYRTYYEHNYGKRNSGSRILLPDHSRPSHNHLGCKRPARGSKREYNKRTNLWHTDCGWHIQRHSQRNQRQWDGHRDTNLDNQSAAQWSLCWLSPSGFLNTGRLAQ